MTVTSAAAGDVNKKKVVALISTDYPPLRTSAAVQMHDLATEMRRSGHRTIMIVPTVDLSEELTAETVEGVEVVRIRAPRTRDISYVRRTLMECSLPFLMLTRLRRTTLLNKPIDIVAWYSPTIFFGPLIWYLRWRTGCRTYLILRDIFPEWTLDLGLMRRGPAFAFFKAVAYIQYAVADVIGVQTESNVPYMKGWQQKSGRRVEVLHNWQTPTADKGSTIDISSTHLAGRKIAVYIGNMGVAQGMDVLLDLAESFADRKEIGFVFVGRGSEVARLKKRVETSNLTNTLFFDEVDSSEMPGLLSQCYVGLLALDPRHKTHNIPGKFLTYLIAGLPVIARVNQGTDLMELINRERVGAAFDSSESSRLHESIDRLLKSPEEYDAISLNGRKLARQMFSSSNAVRQIIASSLGDVR